MSTNIIILAGLAVLAFQCVHGLSDGPFDENCPVTDKKGLCYKVFTGKTMTRTEAKQFCKYELSGKIGLNRDGQLADIMNADIFNEIVNYMQKDTLEDLTRDSKVLTGMKYVKEGTIKDYDGDVLPPQVWYTYVKPATDNAFGAYYVLQASKTHPSLCRLKRNGDSNTSYKSVLCQYYNK